MATALTADICRHVAESTAEQRVKRGAKWLDENFPGWEGRIDLDTLDVSSGIDCICGQVFADKVDDLQEKDVASVSTGFDVAYMTLFTEANSWISALVGPKLPASEAQLLGEEPWTPEQRDRRTVLSRGLGFIESTDSSGYVTVEGDFNDEVTYEDLTEAWLSLLRHRRATGTFSKAPEPVGGA